MRSGTLCASVLALALSVVAGCQGDPYTAVYTTGKPDPADLVGSYVPDEATLRLIADRGRYAPRAASITLEAGGALRFKDVPDWWNTFGRPGGEFDSAEGTWKVELDQDRWWAVGVRFPEARFASRGGEKTDFSARLMLVGKEPPYSLHLTIGDPDEGVAMQFVREGAAGGK